MCPNPQITLVGVLNWLFRENKNKLLNLSKTASKEAFKLFSFILDGS